MSRGFPRVGVIGVRADAQLLIAPALSLGLEISLFAGSESVKECDYITYEDCSLPISTVRTLESSGIKVYPSSSTREFLQGYIEANSLTNEESFTPYINVTVARSPHGQATSWAPTRVIPRDQFSLLTVTPDKDLSAEVAEKLQQDALDIAQKISLVGVMRVNFSVDNGEIRPLRISLLPGREGRWSIDGAVTSQYEQHLRAILDLPLGSPELVNSCTVSATIFTGLKSDMYRPYLHLMARTPKLKFHQYRDESRALNEVGHVALVGNSHHELVDEVTHAVDYMVGVIEE